MLNATIQFVSDAQNKGVVTITFKGELHSNASNFSNVDRILPRRNTTAFVNWTDIPFWFSSGHGDNQTTPNLELIIEEIVNQTEWTENNSIVIMASCGPTDAGINERRATSFDGGGITKLNITYRAPMPFILNEDIEGGFRLSLEHSGVFTVVLKSNKTQKDEVIIKSNGALLNDSSWHFFAFVKNQSNNLTLYIDNTVVSTNATLTNIGYNETARALIIDAEERLDSGVVTNNTRNISLVYNTTFKQEVAFYFPDVEVPAGASIINATLRFVAARGLDTSDGANNTNLSFYGNLHVDAPLLTTAVNNITNRTKTAASVNWSNVPTWLSGEGGDNQTTPNLAPIIEEITNQSGWNQGNAIVIIVRGNGTRTAQEANTTLRIQYSYSLGNLSSFFSNLPISVTERNAQYFAHMG